MAALKKLIRSVLVSQDISAFFGAKIYQGFFQKHLSSWSVGCSVYGLQETSMERIVAFDPLNIREGIFIPNDTGTIVTNGATTMTAVLASHSNCEQYVARRTIIRLYVLCVASWWLENVAKQRIYHDAPVGALCQIQDTSTCFVQ